MTIRKHGEGDEAQGEQEGENANVQTGDTAAKSPKETRKANAKAKKAKATVNEKADNPGQTEGDAAGQQAQTTQSTMQPDSRAEQRVNREAADAEVRRTAKPPQSSRPGVVAGEHTAGSAGVSSGDDVVTVNDRDSVRKLRDGQKFYAPFLHNPKTDNAREVEPRMSALQSGSMVRHDLPQSYWRNHAHERPPLAQRDSTTTSGYRFLD
jgi:hypothetical protein